MNVTVWGSLRSLTPTGSTATALGRLWMSGIVEVTDGAELSAFSITVTESETAFVTYAVCPSGVMATALGASPTVRDVRETVGEGESAPSISVTVPPYQLVR